MSLHTRAAAAVALALFWVVLLTAIGAGRIAFAPLVVAALVFAWAYARRAPIQQVYVPRVRGGARRTLRRLRALVVRTSSRGATAGSRLVAVVGEGAKSVVERSREWRPPPSTAAQLEAERRQARHLNRTASEHRREGRSGDAITYAERALSLLSGLGVPRDEALTLSNLGLALVDAGDYDRAAGCYDRSIEILRWLGDEQTEAQVVANLGMLHERQDREADALDCWRQALERLDPESPEYSQLAARVEAA